MKATTGYWLLLTELLSCFHLNAQWVQTGPYGGHVIQLTKTGSDLFAGTASGVFRSTNGGMDWEWRSTGLAGGSVVALLGRDAGVFAGTYLGGVFRSTDHGDTWVAANSGLTDLHIKLLQTAGSSMFVSTVDSGLFRSDDEGLSWISTTAGISQRVYALTAKDTFVFAGTILGGIYRSTDNGSHWSPANSGLGYKYVYSLAVKDTLLLAGTLDGIYRSTNNGTAWGKVWDGNGVESSIEVASNSIFVGLLGGIIRSTDDGTSWTSTNSGVSDSVVTDIQMLDSNLFAATVNGGVFQSTDNGESWHASNHGIAIAVIGALVPDENGLYLGAHSLGMSGVFHSTDDGNTWIRSTLGRYVYALVKDGPYLIAASNGGGAFVSTDHGLAWSSPNTGLTNMYLTSLLVVEGGTSGGPPVTHIIAGADGFTEGNDTSLFFSSNHGVTWNAINDGFSRDAVSSLEWQESYLYVGKSFRGVQRFMFTGSTWTLIDTVLYGAGTINAINASEGTIYAGSYGLGVYRSTDDGVTWDEANNGLGSRFVNTISANGPNVIVGTQNGGIWFSSDYGNTWATASAGLPDAVVHVLAVSGTQVFAGTNLGAWRRPISEIVTGVGPDQSETPSGYVLLQNYPNPFNSSTQISFSLLKSSRVRLKVFDLLGREIMTILDEVLKPGSYSRSFHADGVASGVYLYRLDAGGSTSVRKMVLLR